MLKFPWYEYEGVELNMISHDREYANELIFDSTVCALTFILSKCVETLKTIL